MEGLSPICRTGSHGGEAAIYGTRRKAVEASASGLHAKLGVLWGVTSDEDTVSTLLVEAVSLSVASAEVLDAARQGDGDAAARAVARLTTVARRVAKAAKGAKK